MADELQLPGDVLGLLGEKYLEVTAGTPGGPLVTDGGTIQPGKVADLVIFNPATIKDNATYENPHQYADGIIHVIVNGDLVIGDELHTGDRPGEILSKN